MARIVEAMDWDGRKSYFTADKYKKMLRAIAADVDCPFGIRYEAAVELDDFEQEEKNDV